MKEPSGNSFVYKIKYSTLSLTLVSLSLIATASTAERSFSNKSSNNERLAVVALSGLVEAHSIYNFNNPVPYMGVPALYENKRFRALSYAALNVSLYKIKDHFDPRSHRSRYDIDATLYPNRSTPTTFFRYGAGVSPQFSRDASLSDLIHRGYYYMRMVEIYSTYRNLHARTASTNRVKPKKTSIASLAMSPFKWRYIKNPWVYTPLVIAGGLSFLLSSSENPSLSDAQEIVMLGNQYSPNQVLLLYSAIAIYKYVLTATGEEMYWRGIMQTELTERLHPRVALVVSSLLFGAWHIPNNGLGSSIGATVAGGYLGYRYKSNGYDLGEVIATHFWINVVGNVVEFMKDPSGNSFVYKINWKL